ncbi:MAG: P-loop NTPase fold protein [Solirubrobacteraceae bacterium]
MATSKFTLLDDQPYCPVAEALHDPLGFHDIANDLASLIRASRGSTPLALGIEGGWDMGKSTLNPNAAIHSQADRRTTLPITSTLSIPPPLLVAS